MLEPIKYFFNQEFMRYIWDVDVSKFTDTNNKYYLYMKFMYNTFPEYYCKDFVNILNKTN
jgi:hypothetical protein